MLKKKLVTAALYSLAAACVLAPAAGMAADAKPKVLKPCMQCHKGDAEDVIRGKLTSVSMKAETLNVSTGGATWLVGFDEDTALDGAEAMNKIETDHEISVKFVEEDGKLYASKVNVKKPAKLDPKQIISFNDLAPLVEKGPKDGNFTIVDARPGKVFLEGHIQGAISIYDAQFDENVAKLPKDKNQLLVFYCGGPTWRLSPSSARRAEKLGYTNVKVFLDGLPEWKKNKQPLYASAKYVNEMAAFKNSVVVIDVRPDADVQAAHIEGAVAVAADGVATMKDKFPAKKTAPIIVVAADDTAARKAFATIREWGYKNAAILQGGMQSWQKEGFAIQAGKTETDIVYVPKPIPGAMSADDFKALLAKNDSGTVIVDVRTEEEAQDGRIAGALNIPTDEISDRVAEIPKDKPIITYCSTGLRAEMAYAALKEKGYNVKFLNGKTDFEGGKPTISEN